MYYYLYDSFLVDKKYRKLIANIETRLSELEISGKIIRLSLLKSVREAVEDISKEHNPTIVIIGKDETFSEAVCANWKDKSPLFGFIPVDSHSELSSILDLPLGMDSCDVISQRRILEMDLGKINNHSFFTYLEFPANQVFLFSKQGWKIDPSCCWKVRIVNLGFRQDLGLRGEIKDSLVSRPSDGYLELITLKRKKKYWLLNKGTIMDSLFFVRNLRIEPVKQKKDMVVQLNGRRTIKAPFDIRLSSRKVRVIVGRERLIS